MNRLTDDKVAKELEDNIRRLEERGIEPDVSDRRYVALARYEHLEEYGTVHARPRSNYHNPIRGMRYDNISSLKRLKEMKKNATQVASEGSDRET